MTEEERLRRELEATTRALEETQRKLVACERRMVALLESTSDVILMLDASGSVTYVSPSVERVLGWKPSEVLGRPLPPPHPDDVAVADKTMRDVLGQPGLRVLGPPARARHAEGRWVVLEPVMMNLLHVPEVAALVMHARDVTERQRAEVEHAKLRAQVQHAQKLESLGVLAGGIAHDFNNLLVAMLGNVSLARMELETVSPVHDYLADCELAGQRAADLCRQMLAYSGRGRFVVEPIDLSALVEDTLHLLQVSLSKKAVLKLALAKDLPRIEAEGLQVRQVLLNLVTNASEAIEERSGVVTITTGAMECDRGYLRESYLDDDLPEGVYVYMEIADTGCGMDPGTREKIFDPFFTTKFPGRGLGLAAVLGIVRGHRGAVKVYSEPGRGSTLKVLFPAVPGLPAATTDRKGPNLPRSEGAVLVVDDEETVRATVRRLLEHEGFRVLTAADGRAGVEVYKEHAPDIALVILDMTMPHLDGSETYRELRRIKSDVRVILSSGYSEQEAVSKFAGKGLAGFLQKPFRVQELMTLVDEVLRGRTLT
ncbi:MAG: response regulator [Myxococcales bacterium]|nr:response regulator [Myxococcales bacterium]